MELKFTTVLFLAKRRTLILFMKIFIFLFCTAVFSLSSGNVFSQNVKINIDSDKLVTADEVFEMIKKQTDYRFVYKSDAFKASPKIQLKKGLIKAHDLIIKVLSHGDYAYQLTKNRTILLTKKPEVANSLQDEVKGVVTDNEGLPLPGVTVIEKGTTNGVASDFNGNYTIKVSSADAILVFSYIGYTTQEVKVENRSEINIQLIQSANQLDEVIITGYQEIKANETTAAYKNVTNEQLDRKTRTNITNKLEGLVPGLVLTPDPTEEGARKLNIRGLATVTGNANPLIVVDGFPLVGDLSTINPNDVETITVLKDASAASIYGSQSANGVIVITTKKGALGEKFRVDYTSSYAITQAPDLSYSLQRATTDDIIDLHQGTFVDGSPSFLDATFNIDRVYNALNRAQFGVITQDEANNIINGLRGTDNLSQLQDELVKDATELQQNVSISGGSAKNTYRASLNYVNNKPNTPTQNADRVIFDLRNSSQLSDKIKLDISGNFSLFNSKENILDRNVLLGLPAYNLLRDSNGNPLPVELGSLGVSTGDIRTGGKSPSEIQRLIDLGLLDETFIPLSDFNERSISSKSFNMRLQALLNIDILKNLKGTIGFQYENGNSKSDRFASGDSREMRNIINNAASNSFTGSPEDYNIPLGGSLRATRGDRESYTLRGLLNFNKNFSNSDHIINSIAGFELRSISSTGSIVTRFGYNPVSLQFQSINELGLREGIPTQDSNSSILFFDVNDPNLGFNNFTEQVNRFVSAYGNASYTYKRRYTASGSIRVDQSNLFGTNPKFRYKPLWSAGLAWNVSNEPFFNVGFIDNLNLRYTYGVNGNIDNLQGPFTIAQTQFAFRTQSQSNRILSPANNQLRRESTYTSNIGLDLSVFKNRLNLTLDYYNRNSEDLLAPVQTDPTSGFPTLVLNQSSIENKGFEIGLNANIIQSENFQWSSNINLRTNKNLVKRVFIENDLPAFRVAVPAIVEGFPANSLFSYRFGGLDEEGRATAIKEDGTVITDSRAAEITDLVHTGTVDPTVSGGITNNIRYKGFELSFLFVYNGGHVMINDTYGGIYSAVPISYHSDVNRRWRQPGDEATTNIPAAASAPQNIERLFTRADINVLEADYLKLRELIFSYNFNENVLSKTPFKDLGIRFQADNLFYWAKNDEGIDPEAHGLGRRFFSIEPTFTFGIRASF
ncbi:SusC/RagA family TonB-linked outer membrane protein [Aureibaculum sp. 2210JD6-5]|uniref:SusC/RagA family TonB-linked outer membrane protein n=1 Tax=Aureibaculum sp. 2210JD6-5 TaxID=3103957 RepID=UPI002AAEF285|nr:SusC/RagA family TonB-linked outer membrane protein [Aureibaculum sp. 2210JD6-5]MDY7396755.1 SusC/RagA family TonB-linked outer membrane protein [Aureibaculum sp. 2210JD6-5]